MKLNKKQFSGFLDVIKLRGYDDEVKMRSLVNDVVIEVGDNSLQAYGLDDTEQIPFNHIMEIEIEEEDNDPERLIITDITKWIVYVDSLKGSTISITEEESYTVLRSGNELYQEPLSVEDSIRSFVRSMKEPMLPYDGDGWYDIGDRDEWSEFNFKPGIFLDSITSGKNVNNMNVLLNIGKSVFAIEIGDINDPATQSYKNSNVEGVTNVTWNFKKNKLHEWRSKLGLHSIINVIENIDHASEPSIFFKGPDKNLIIRTNDASINGAPIKASWAISTPKIDEHEYEKELEELAEG